MRLATSYGLDEDDVTTAVIASMGDNRGIRAWGRHDRKRAIRAAQGTDWSERMGRDLEEAAIAAGAHGITLPITAVIAEAMPHMLRRRDRELAARPQLDPVPLCSICDQDLAAAFRSRGVHPECTPEDRLFPSTRTEPAPPLSPASRQARAKEQERPPSSRSKRCRLDRSAS